MENNVIVVTRHAALVEYLVEKNIITSTDVEMKE